MATIGRTAQGHVTIDGVPTMIRGLYISFPPGNAGDMASQVEFFKLARFRGKLNAILHIMAGTFWNSVKLCGALDPLGMYVITPGNGFGGYKDGKDFDYLIDPANLDVAADRDGFRANFAAHKRALGVYLYDEPHDTQAALDDAKQWHATYKQAMPNLPTMTVLIQYNLNQIRKWAAQGTGEWLGADPYVWGADAENNVGGAPSTYGYMNFVIPECAAAVRYHALANGKVPFMVFQLMKFGDKSRFITDSALWSHAVATVAEGITVNWWWELGIQDGALYHASVPATERDRMLSQLDKITTHLAALEPMILTAPNPALIMANSLDQADPITWRKALVSLLRSGASDRPVWLWGLRSAYDEEFARLSQTPPDTSMSVQMLDQQSDVRARAWEVGDVGLVAAYNVHPLPRTATLTWHKDITRVEVVGENRDVPVAGGRSWTDTYGGGSSLRQGPFHQAHIYRLTLAGSGPVAPPPPPPPVVTGHLSVTLAAGSRTVVHKVHGPVLVLTGTPGWVMRVGAGRLKILWSVGIVLSDGGLLEGIDDHDVPQRDVAWRASTA